MSNEPQKQPSAAPEHPFPPATYHPQHFGGGTYPPPGPYPPYFAYPPQPEGTQGDSNPNGNPPAAPYMMPFPPHGMVYAYPPPAPGQAFSPCHQGIPSALSRPKRRQVKMACTNCATACKRCDEARPCERCIKYGIADACVDGTRKERKKGIKRGPYKRKNKSENGDLTYHGEHPEGEWNHASPPTPATTSAAMQAVAQFTPPEGYYPYYYPPPGFIPPGHEGQPGPDGAPPNANGQPQPILQYYVHPSGYPPYSHFPHPGPAPYPPHAQPPQTLNPADSTKKPDEPRITEQPEGAAVQTKKKSRAPKNGEQKSKKPKGTGGRSQKGKKASESGEAAVVENHESNGPV